VSTAVLAEFAERALDGVALLVGGGAEGRRRPPTLPPGAPYGERRLSGQPGGQAGR
jgi:hypothetical protein